MSQTWIMPGRLGQWKFPITYLANGWGVSVASIDAELAGRMLESNSEANRNRRKSLMARYSTDMKTGHWLLTHQGIAFDVNGHLHDGQNRLAACVESGVTFQSLVFFGVGKENEMNAFDTGGNRNAVDAAKISGYGTISHNDTATLRAFMAGPTMIIRAMPNWEILDKFKTYLAMIVFTQQI